MLAVGFARNCPNTGYMFQGVGDPTLGGGGQGVGGLGLETGTCVYIYIYICIDIDIRLNWLKLGMASQLSS